MMRSSSLGLWFVVSLAIVFGPGASEAQIPAPGAQAFQSGCSGAGPGIIAGRVPNFSQDSGGVARIVAGGPNGDAYLSEVRSEEASRQWVFQMVGDPKAAAAYEKNPVQNPAALSGFKGDLHDSQAVLAFFASEQEKMKRAMVAVQSASTVTVNKDASFECRGLPSGKYHVIVTINHGSMQAAMSGSAAGVSQTTLESDVEIPRVKNGQRVIVQITQYSVLSSLKN